MTTAREARAGLGWRYRRGVAALVFLPLVLLLLFVGHKTLGRYVFELEVENRREIKVARSPTEVQEMAQGLASPLDEPAPDCWLEISRARLARNKAGRVEVIRVDVRGRPEEVRGDATAAEDLATVVSPLCWRQTNDQRLVHPWGDSGIAVLRELKSGARARGFEAFGALALLFALGGMLVGVVLRRPAGLEVAGAAAIAALVEILLLMRSIGWDASVLGELLVVHDALGYDYAAILGFAPIVFLSFVVGGTGGLAGLTATMIDEIRGVQRCGECLAPSEHGPSGAPCPRCGAKQPRERVEWLVVSASVLASGLVLVGVLAMGAKLGVFEVCTYVKPSEMCTAAMHDTEGLFAWDYYAQRGLFDGDPGRLIVFRPALYVVLATLFFVLVPFVIGRLLRGGYRTTLAVLPALWITSFVVSAAVVAGGLPYFYLVLIRWHLGAVLPFAIIGMTSATIGLRLRGSTEAGLLEDLSDDDEPIVAAAAPMEDAAAARPGPTTAFRGAIPGAVRVEEPLPEDVVAALRPPFVLRHKWKLLGVLAVLAAAGAGVVAYQMRPLPADRFLATPFGKALGDPLTKYCIDMNGSSGAEARAQILSDDVKGQIGADAVDDLRGVLDAAVAYEKSPRVEGADSQPRALFVALNGLDDKLATRGVPAHLGAYTARSQVWLLAYAVHVREDIKVGGRSLRAIRGFRVDTLNFSDSTAYKPNQADWVTISLEALETEFLGVEMGAVVRGTLAKPGGDTTNAKKNQLLTRAGELIGAEIVAGSKLSKDDAASVDGMLKQRDAWLDGLRVRGLGIDHDHMLLPRRTVSQLTASKDAAIEQVLKLDRQLGAYRQGLVSALDLLADLEEEEFVVRLMEEERLKDTSLAAFEKEGIDKPTLRAIASAELSKLARPQKCPRLALWRTAEKAWGTGYSGWGHSTGHLVLGALLKELGVAVPADFAEKDIDDPEMAAAVLAAMEKPPGEIEKAAGRAYLAIFGQAPPTFARVPTKG